MLEKIKKLLAPPIFENEDKTRTAQYINATLLTGIILLAIFVLSGTYSLTINAIFSAIALFFLVLRYFLFQGQVRVTGILLVTISWIAFTYLAWIGEGVRDIAVIVYIFLILVASLFGNARTSIGLTVLSILSLWTLFFAQEKGYKIPISDSLLANTFSTTGLYILFEIIIYFTISNLNKTISAVKENEKELLIRNKELLQLQDELHEHASELEKITKEAREQASRLETIAEVSQAIALSQNLEELLAEIVKRISEGFGFYHVGVFSIDDDQNYVRLRAANSDDGKTMLANAYRLEIADNDIVARAALNGRSHSAIKTEEDSEHFSNSQLIKTKAKIALPLKIGNRTIGVLDIQSTEERSFSLEETRAFQSLANQVAIAIENASQVETTQAALEEARATSRQYIHQEWVKLEATKQQPGYRYAGSNISPLEDEVIKENKKDTLSIPVQVHEKTIGVIEIRRNKDKKELNSEEQELVQAVAERTALALENARLLENSQRLVAKEQVIGDISEKLSSTAEIENLMQIAVAELRNTLGASEVTINISPDE